MSQSGPGLSLISTFSRADEAADLVVWDIAEAALSMMGACIPVLRVLIRDARGRATDNSAHGPRSFMSWWSWTDSGSAPTAVATARSAARAQRSDDLSDKSILDGAPADRSGILRTNEVDVEYQAHKDEVVYYQSNAFELQKVA